MSISVQVFADELCTNCGLGTFNVSLKVLCQGTTSNFHTVDLTSLTSVSTAPINFIEFRDFPIEFEPTSAYNTGNIREVWFEILCRWKSMRESRSYSPFFSTSILYRACTFQLRAESRETKKYTNHGFNWRNKKNYLWHVLILLQRYVSIRWELLYTFQTIIIVALAQKKCSFSSTLKRCHCHMSMDACFGDAGNLWTDHFSFWNSQSNRFGDS